MIAVNYTTIRNNLKTYCDKAIDENQDIIITRKDNKNVVLLNIEKYNELMKNVRNIEYLYKIDCSIEQLRSNKGKIHELIEVDDE